MKLPARVAPVLVFLAALGLYVPTLAPGMLRGDSGEFQWAMVSLNVAHATGYPLFTLLGYAWQLIPLSNNVAWQLNLLAAFFAALAAATIYVLIRAITARNDAALVGALFFALAPVIWFNASILEVYSLHTFLLTLFLYLLYRWSQNPQESAPLYLTFLVLGLALAHHRLVILTAPAILYFLLATDRRFFLNLPRVLLCGLLLLPGLALYVYVPLRLLPAGFSFDYAFYDIILGGEYATSLLRELNPLPVLAVIPFQNFHIGLVIALLGAVVLFFRSQDATGSTRLRHFNIALLLIYLADVAFALVYSVPDVQVFLTSAFVVTALWIGAGAAFILKRIGERVGETYARRIELPFAIVLILLPLYGLIHYPEIRTLVAAEAAPEARARAIAGAGLAQGALLELDWETATALRFLQTTEKLRTDLEARLIGMDHRDEFWHALYNVEQGRAVWMEKGVNWSRAPAGFVTQSGANDLTEIVRVPVEMKRVKMAVNDRVDLLGYQSTPDAFIVYWRVNKPLDKDVATYVHYLDAKGDKIGQDDRAACCEAVYGYRTSEWEAGQVYADVFSAEPPNSASILVGMYENLNGDIEPYGDEITLKP